MNRCYSLLTTALALLLLSFVPAQAQDLNVYLSASNHVAGPGERIIYSITVTNTGSVDLFNAGVAVQLPESIDAFGPPPGWFCGNSSNCAANELVSWTVGTLPLGQSRTTTFNPRVGSAAPEEIITISVTATADGQDDATALLDVQVDPTPLVRLSIAPDPGPAVPGEPFTYTLTYGNTGSTSPSSVVLTMAVPEGASFVEATGGGTESGGVVTWNVGLVPAAGGGELRMTVEVDAALENGDALEAAADINPGVPNEFMVRSSSVTPVRAGSALRLEYAISQTATGTGDVLDYTLTATNTGPVDLLGVGATVLNPAGINEFAPPPGWFCGNSSNCAANERVFWTVGDLAPGQSLQTVFRTRIANAAVPGSVGRSSLVAAAQNAGQVLAAQDVQVDPTPLVRLSIAPDPGPAVPGEPFTYTLTYGNTGSTSPSSVVLTMAVPEGASFVEATGGGTESGGVVTWNIGLLAAAAGEQVRLTVLPNASLVTGSLLSARAEIDSGVGTEYVVRSSSVTPVRAGSALRLEYAISQTATGTGDVLDYTLTATNTGPVDLLGVGATVLNPAGINEFAPPPGWFCGNSSNCAANERVFWTVGDLAPGQSLQTVFRTRIANAAVPGSVGRSSLVAAAQNAGQVLAAQDVQVDPTPLVRLSIAPDPGPAVPGEPFTYTLTYGNTGPANPTDATVRMSVPEGTSFVSATSGATPSNGVVTWIVPLFQAGRGDQVTLTVMPDTDLADGSLLMARAEVDSGINNEYVVRSSSVTPVRASFPLRFEYTVDPAFLSPGDVLDYTLTATNTGPVDLLGVGATVLNPAGINEFAPPPGWFCGNSSNCAANERVFWTVGDLAPEQSGETSFTTAVGSSVPPGSILRSLILTAASNSNQTITQQDVLVGQRLPPPPPPTSNEEGTVEELALGVEAYPTPFVGATTFALSLPEGGKARLVVYDVLGRAVATLAQEPLAAGRHEVQWNARGLPSGVYFYRLDTAQGVRSGSLVKVR